MTFRNGKGGSLKVSKMNQWPTYMYPQNSSAQAATINTLIKTLEAYIQKDILLQLQTLKRKKKKSFKHVTFP